MPAHSSAAPPEPSAPTPLATEAVSFETAMERLEVIVEQMENAQLPLEELIRSYEEGTRLIRVCSERLSVAEQRIEIITRDAAGQPRVAEYTSPAASAAASPPAPSPAPKPVPVAPARGNNESPPAVSRPSKTPNEVSLF